MDINILGNMDNSDGTFESANRVYDSNGLAPTLPTCSGGGIQPKVLEVEVLGGMGEKKSNGGQQYYQQDRIYNTETICPALNGSGDELVPKILIRQNTKDGLIPCKIGGGGRFELPGKQNKTGACNRERRDMPDLDNGEYP